MKHFLACAAATLALTAAPALAQDAADWTGPYIGVQGGYTSAKSDTTVTLGGAWTSEPQTLRDFFPAAMGTRQSDGNANIGGVLGYNFGAGGAVLGVEGEFTVLNGGETVLRGPIAYPAMPTLTYSFMNIMEPKHMFALKAKAGVPLGRTLVYVDGGWAWTKAKLGVLVQSSGNYRKAGEVNKTLDGFIIGGGVEHRLADSNLSLRLTYHYADQGEETYNTAYLPGSAFTTPAYSETVRQDLKLHLVRVGVNYAF